MTPWPRYRCASLALVLAWLVARQAAAEDAPNIVVVELKPRATASGRTITVGDVADVRGSDAVRARLACLDIAEFASAAAPVTVRRAHVDFRLRLADVPPALFRLTGAAEVIVTPVRQALPEDQLIATGRAALLRRLPWAADDVSVQPLKAVTAPLPVATDPADLHFVAEPHTPGVLTGRVQMDVTVFVRGERRLAVPVYFEVRPLQSVAVCRHRVERGAALTEAAMFIERRPVDSGASAPPPAHAVIGKRAKRTLQPGQVIGSADVEDSPAEGPIVVKVRQSVTMTVRVGAVSVVAKGEAQQEGRVGETIRLINLDSRKVVTGRVTGPGVVDVEIGGVP